jgi:hypothetical protein
MEFLVVKIRRRILGEFTPKHQQIHNTQVMWLTYPMQTTIVIPDVAISYQQRGFWQFSEKRKNTIENTRLIKIVYVQK